MKILRYIIGLIIGIIIGFLICYFTNDNVCIEKEYIIQNDTVHIENRYYYKQRIDTAKIIIDCVKKNRYYHLFPYKSIQPIITKEDSIRRTSKWYLYKCDTVVLINGDTIGEQVATANKKYLNTSVMLNRFDSATNIGYENNDIPLYGRYTLNSSKLNMEQGYMIDGKYGVSFNYQHNFKRNNNTYSGKFIYKF